MSKESSQRLRRVAVLIDEGSNPFEMACLTEILGIDRPEVGGLLYEVQLCSRTARVGMRQQFFVMTGVGSLQALETADTVIVPNRPDVSGPHHPDVLDAIRRAHRRGARLVGMCSGAFTLAEAGVLDGRRATVHWQWADRFRAAHPQVDLDETVLFIDDGDILTSAGSAAALDLGLHIVALDHGAEVAAAVARRLVFAAHRVGGQRQFIETPVPAATRGNALGLTLEWALGNLQQPLTIQHLASRAGMSRASLHRQFRTSLGLTPLAWLHAQRIARARRLLETTDFPVDRIARESGFGTDATLRAHLRRSTGLTPSHYRAQNGSAGRIRPAP